MFKKILSFMLCVVLVTSSSLTALASNKVNTVNDSYVITDKTQIHEAQEHEKENYSFYNIDLKQNFPRKSIANSTRKNILELCHLSDSVNINNMKIDSYTSNEIQDLLYKYYEIIEISDIQGILHISYITTENKEVRLVYDDDGLLERAVYDIDSDIAYIETKTSSTIHENFREGISYEMNEETLNKINKCFEEGNIDELKRLQDLDVTVDNDGNVFVEPNLNSIYMTRSSEGFTSTSELLSDLKASFKPYTNKKVYSTSKYCNALSKNISLKVLDTRNAYTKKSANWKNFAIETTLSAIGLYLGLPTTAIATILSAHGIAISTTNFIKEAVTLYKSAVYTFSGIKRTYVYDTTVYNDWVRVYGLSNKGEFTGGYNSKDVFTWVISETSSALEKSNSTVVNKAASNYNADILSHGYCSLYEPD